MGWGGFTTHDLKRCRLLARSVALIYNWWSCSCASPIRSIIVKR